MQKRKLLKVHFIYEISILKIWGINAITLYPFIFFASSAERTSPALFRHELEHVYQVQKLGWWKFYFTYLKFYFSFRRQGLDHQAAYWTIPYEVEARQKESHPLTEFELALRGTKEAGSLDRS